MNTIENFHIFLHTNFSFSPGLHLMLTAKGKICRLKLISVDVESCVLAICNRESFQQLVISKPFEDRFKFTHDMKVGTLETKTILHAVIFR